MGTGVCLKGTKNVPIKHSQSYFYLMMYIFIEMLLSFKITFYIFVWDINIWFNFLYWNQYLVH